MRVVFAGTPDFSVPCLQVLIEARGIEVVGVYTQPDRPAGRGRKIQQSPVKERALANHITVFQPDSLKIADNIHQLRQLNPDLMVVTAYGLLLPQEVLDIPTLGCVNIHASLLPRWRGAAPIQRAIAAGDGKTGVTLMQMEYRLDAGPILAKSELEITEDETGGSLHDRLAKSGGDLLAANLENLKNAALTPVIQDQRKVTYAEKLSKSETPLNWEWDAAVLARKCRAFYPWPVATVELSGIRLRVISCSSQEINLPNDQNNRQPAPGEVVSSNGSGVLVSTGKGFLNLEVLQKPGSKPLIIKQFLNGMPIPVGTVLN